MSETAVFDALAFLFRYPEGAYELRVGEAFKAMFCGAPDAGTLLMRLQEEIAPLTPDQIEELYTITFDLSPVVSLEIGWHLFGEAYERGRLLATLRAQLVKAGLDEGGELPDHLGNVLRLIPRLPDDEPAKFSRAYVLPALDKMLKPLENGENPFRHLLAAARAYVDQQCPPADESLVAAIQKATAGCEVTR